MAHRVRSQVLERDDYQCQDCGAPATDVHHIVGRSRDPRTNDPRNLISLCRWCHELRDKGAGAHTTAARIRHLGMLRERHGYEYEDLGEPWLGLLRLGNEKEPRNGGS